VNIRPKWGIMKDVGEAQSMVFNVVLSWFASVGVWAFAGTAIRLIANMIVKRRLMVFCFLIAFVLRLGVYIFCDNR
jgi:hypothetical protein